MKYLITPLVGLLLALVSFIVAPTWNQSTHRRNLLATVLFF